MITLLLGENSYEIEQALSRLVSKFDGEAEKFDGAELELRQLPDLLIGQSLFSEKRLVIIRGLSGNKQLWDVLPAQLEQMSDDIDLVLVEISPDKRTKTFKALQKLADVKELQLWGERDNRQAEQWTAEQSARMGLKIDASTARAVVNRSYSMSSKGQPAVDQWQIVHNLEKLSVLDTVTPEVVEEFIDEQPFDSVFGMFETALKGDRFRLHQLLKDIKPREDPFRAFGLLSGQVFQLAALVASSQPTADTAKAIGVHPFAMSKLAPFAKKCTKNDVRQIVLALAEADEALKLSKAGPWVLIEQALMKITLVTEGK